jgi:hypothetical protein
MVFLVLAGCADEATDPCGDGMCDRAAGESNYTCSVDCYAYGQCGCTAPLMVCPPLKGNVCIPGFMAGDFLVGITPSRLSPQRDNGTSWDADGAPDPYVIVYVDGTAIGTTEVALDTARPDFNVAFGPALQISSSNALTFEVFDEDGDTDELMVTCSNINSFYWARPAPNTLTNSCTSGETNAIGFFLELQ